MGISGNTHLIRLDRHPRQISRLYFSRRLLDVASAIVIVAEQKEGEAVQRTAGKSKGIYRPAVGNQAAFALRTWHDRSNRCIDQPEQWCE